MVMSRFFLLLLVMITGLITTDIFSFVGLGGVGVEATPIQLIKFNAGRFTVHFLFLNSTLPAQRVVLARVEAESIYFITTLGAVEESTTCRQKSQERVIWGPRGCSDNDNPSQAIESALCIPNEPQRQQRLGIFQQTFQYSKEQNACFLLGGEGDICMCPGPVRFAIQGRDSLLPAPVTAKTLLQKQMAFYDTQTDPSALFPSIVPIILREVALGVNTTCDPTAWNQSFVPFNRDNYPSSFTQVWETFQGTRTPALRVILRGDLNFRIQFVFLEQVMWQSEELLFVFVGEFPSFMDLVVMGYPYRFFNLTHNCTAIFSVPSQIQLEIVAPYYPVPTNVSWNIFPRFWYQTGVCNYMVGQLDHSLELKVPFLPEDAKQGGDPILQDPISGLPLGLDPNPFLDYRFDCNEFYPLNETFLNYGNGVTEENRQPIQRMNVPSELCFAPFILPSLIQLEVNPDERYTQCLKVGGWVHGKARGECARGITQLDCKLGNHYFSGRCYHDFSPVTDQSFAVPLSEADGACKLFSPFASAVVEMDVYLQAWLQGVFIHLQRSDTLYRVPQFGSSGRCLLITQWGVFPDQTCYEITTTGNGTFVFPLCSYPATELIPLYADQRISLQGARLRVAGQVGPLPGGAAATCRCFDGSTGGSCEVRTCPTPTQAQSPGQLTQELFFFQQCSLDNHGECYMRSPGVCVCHFGYGPAASILPSLPLLEQFRDFPCAFPSTPIFKSLQFTVNNILYLIPFPEMWIPCGGVGHGGAILALNDSYARGECQCDQRPQLQNSTSLEDAFQGRACSCDRPIIPWEGLDPNGIIVGGFCNAQGVCCPFGQSVGNPYLGDQYAPQCLEGQSGCQCRNGWGGNSCTCPTPFDLAFGRPIQQIQQPSLRFVDLGGKYLIRFINSNCVPYVTNQVGQNATSKCVRKASLYECFPDKSDNGTQFVYWEVPSVDAASCLEVQAWEEQFQFCGGNHTINPFSGRFYQIAIYRDAFKYLLPQQFTTAGFGCTNTKCMCNTLYGGELCRVGVSSYRRAVGGESLSWAKQFCGEETLVPALFNPVQGRGEPDPGVGRGCRCNPIANVDPTGARGVSFSQFQGRSCQCTDGLVGGELKRCFGHGVCEEPWFPWAWCEVDLDTFLLDPLFRPFVLSVSPDEQVLTLTVEEDSYFYIQDTTTPTGAPVPSVVTLFPTQKPATLSPSKNPTLPTIMPTRNPTKNPTKNPTRNPTKNPTRNPTVPTNNPTKNPTSNPTKNPTSNPTKNPTTRNPTENPTSNPTKNPTTRNPTENPTSNPTKNPTSNPTKNPTTRNPTENPTSNPTKNPTKNPTP